ncbi:aminodeoxychorismate/anthranilate synthase component II [Hymenobacter sp. BT635]|uniref:Aminodeoxychorismate/anthranilate synthase component II n=1 Tax=Hymenobacter nitidus TaxID=2880929 RepID=A0ABS8AEF5_9BACT|nr:aminodeoxychorismate/anthranilate synthase component II [Hymenobacter nitidus]MCB2378813.1 aminodeoxychorismate/anthranilate synthase component II [Hymenobacter nitidus]
MHLLLLDNFDSFTFNLLDYFQQLGATVQVVRNDVPLADLRQYSFDAIVLSPGPGTPAQAGCLMEIIREYHQRVPMLGVCLGHQALGEFFGARLERAARPMHGKVSEVACTEAADPLFDGLPARIFVTRYHSLIINLLPPDLKPLAYTTDAAHELMVFRHRTYPVYGVQFHPEALLTTHGLALLSNWVKCCIIAKDGHSAFAGREISREDGIAD